jgi:cyclopropane-fatty-acyl-phospholipid synthase
MNTIERHRRSLGLGLWAAERGVLPDPFLRYGVRRLLRQRLSELADSTHQAERTREFADECGRGPIAVETNAANEQHYELPAQFFQSVLGPRLKYSCCHWADGVSSLDRAEESALDLTCRRAGVEDGMDLLELGCGWGSLSLWMAERYPRSRVTAVSNSTSQREFLYEQARRRGLSNLEVITADMNEFRIHRRFDRVLSVEMFEHMRNHRLLMQRIAGWLVPGGRLFVHLFCHRETPYLFETRDSHDWMGRYFFTGGMMPSETLLLEYQDDLELRQQWTWDGTHYEKTCNAWLHNMDAQKSRLLALFETTYGREQALVWFHRWRLFFIACAELFGFRDGREWQVAHYLFEKRPAT